MQMTVLGIGKIVVNSMDSPCPLRALATSSAPYLKKKQQLFLAPVTVYINNVDVKIEFKFAKRSPWTNDAHPHSLPKNKQTNIQTIMEKRIIIL